MKIKIIANALILEKLFLWVHLPFSTRALRFYLEVIIYLDGLFMYLSSISQIDFTFINYSLCSNVCACRKNSKIWHDKLIFMIVAAFCVR